VIKTKLLTISLLLAAAQWAAASNPSVEIDIAISELAGSNMSVSGVVVSRQDAMIASEMEGRLTWVAQVGDTIEAGEPVAIVNDHLVQLSQRDAQTQIARLQANQAWLERQSQRLEKLAATNNTAHSELDEVRSRYAMVGQEIAAARIELERTTYFLQQTRVTAPFDGIVVERAMSAGEYTQPGDPLLRLVNTAAAEVSVTAPLRLARIVKTGDEVTVFTAQQRRLAPVRSLVPVGDIRSHMMEVRVALEPGDWLIGEPVSVALPESKSRDQITVSRDALVLRDNQAYVFTIDLDEVAHRVPVDIGIGQGSRIAVSGGIQAGDQVVIRGGESLREGQTVNVLEQRISSR
jgi:RND family efflux transporter MFP subunit